MRNWLVAALLLFFSAGVAAQSVPAFQSGTGGGSQSGGELFFIVQQLQEEVRNLRGKVEEQQHQIETLSRQGRDRYVDLDGRLLDVSQRLSSLESGAGGNNPAASAGSADPSAAASSGPEPAAAGRSFRQPNDFERRTYDAIQEKIRNKQYGAAIDDLYQFISDYPEGDLTINAYYWLGELYLAQSEPDQARQAFTIVTARFPDHRKAPDALYKLGVAQHQLNELAAARSTMQQVQQRYPQSNAAGLAQEFLANNPG